MKSTSTSDLQPRPESYTNAVHLFGTMTEFGRYRLSYEPPQGSIESEFSISISSEADLNQILETFQTFLQAAGYPIEGQDLQLVDEQGEVHSSFVFDSMVGSSVGVCSDR